MKTDPSTEPTPPKKQRVTGTSKLESTILKLEEEKGQRSALNRELVELQKKIEKADKNIADLEKSRDSLMEKELKDDEKKIEQKRQRFSKISGKTSLDSSSTPKS